MNQESARIASIHYLLYGYNAVVVALIAVFMTVTQLKIVRSMESHDFLSHVSALPLPVPEGLFLAILSFSLLFICSRLYFSSDAESVWQYAFIILELNACILLMRSINLSYDGVVLLVVSDLMRRYEGHNKEYLLFFAMVALYLIANYNLAMLKMTVVPFEAYLAYYDSSAQTALLAVRNLFVSFNTIFFIIYMVRLLRHNREETERIRKLNEELGEANERLRAYTAAAGRVAETRERNRLAREIHDTLGHSLTGIAAGIDACMMTIDTAPDFAKNQLAKIRQTALDGIIDVRRSVRKLRPDALEKLPLRYALSKMTSEFAESSGMKITFDVAGWPDNLRKDEEDVIYRIVQEGLTNANRHGRAKRVGITIGGDGQTLRIIIADDGTGCENIKAGFGLTHMEERLQLLNGSLRFWSDAGFIIEATIPLHQENNTDEKNVTVRQEILDIKEALHK